MARGQIKVSKSHQSRQEDGMERTKKHRFIVLTTNMNSSQSVTVVSRVGFYQSDAR